MSEILKSQLTGPSVWNGKTFKNNETWLYNLSSDELSEIDSALKNLSAANIKFPNFLQSPQTTKNESYSWTQALPIGCQQLNRQPKVSMK